MVIDKATKGWETSSRFPDTNFTEAEDVWVVPDKSELAQKILGLGVHWDPVTDEEGNLIDVTPDGAEDPEPPVHVNQNERIAQLEAQVEQLTTQVAELTVAQASGGE